MRPRTAELLVGVLSDTHGRLRPEALAALGRVSHILHAGDVGDASVLERLRDLAPLTAVRGNMDGGAWALTLPVTAFVTLGAARIYVIHDAARLGFDPAEDGLQAVVSGHTHLARSERFDGVLHFNPGSAGPRRHERPVTVGRLRIRGRRVEGEIIELRVP
jgi:putative phosphoesterase